jgi:hypothetical protein
MAGFDNTPPASEYRKYTSWGRTRQPKNVAGAHGTQLVDFGAVAPTQTAPDPANGVYATENQRFLQLHGYFARVHVFSYATGVWKTLVEVDPSTGAPAIVSTAATNQARIVEIAGMDLVAFDLAATPAYATCSTF